MAEFDVLVVGSGISGGWVAKEMAEKGFRVAVVERGPKIEPEKDYRDFLDPWEYENFGRPTRQDHAERPVQKEVYAFTPNTRHLWANDLEAPYETPPEQAFSWFRGHQEGGRSLTWGRQTYRWSAADFEANKRDGIAVDWPVRYDDIRPWYDHVEKFAGISGSAEGLDAVPDGIFQPPFALNCGEEWLKENLEDAFPGRKLIPGRCAHLTAPTDEQTDLGRGQCQVRNRCHKGCSFGAHFSSKSATLPAAERTGNYTLITDSVVTSVDYDQASNRVTGVNVINTRDNSRKTITANVVFLNASTIATAAILLNSKSEAFPNGLANSSGQVGRNLMDHVMVPAAAGGTFWFGGKYYSGNRPTGFYIPRYRNLSEPGEGYIRGFGYQGAGFRLGWERTHEEKGIGRKFKEKQRQPGLWAFYLIAFCEVLPDYNNHVRLHETRRDKYGIPVPVIDATFGDNENNMVKQATEDAMNILSKSGCWSVQPLLEEGETHKPFGAGIHEMGTARMGHDPKDSVLNQWNQSHDIPNLFITDGSFMTSGACQNLSLTYMAFSARAADHAASLMRAGQI